MEDLFSWNFESKWPSSNKYKLRAFYETVIQITPFYFLLFNQITLLLNIGAYCLAEIWAKSSISSWARRPNLTKTRAVQALPKPKLIVSKNQPNPVPFYSWFFKPRAIMVALCNPKRPLVTDPFSPVNSNCKGNELNPIILCNSYWLIV